MLPNPLFPADLITFTEEILNEKLYFVSRIFLLPQMSFFSSVYSNEASVIFSEILLLNICEST